MKKTTFEVDLNNPKEAYKLAHNAVKDAVNTTQKHKWTEAEVKEAEKIISELMVAYVRKRAKSPLTIFSSYTDERVSVMYGLDEFVSTPCVNDEYNPVIGTCVALCKAFGEPIPKFISDATPNEADEPHTLADLIALFFS